MSRFVFVRKGIQRLALVTVLGVSVLVASSAAALVSLSIAPAVVEFDLRPGESATRELTFTNKGDSPQVVKAEIWDLDFGPGGERIVSPPGAKSGSVTSWFMFQPPFQTIPPGHYATFQMTVSVPQGVTGGHYANAYLASIADGDKPGVGIATRLPIRVLINAGGEQPRLGARIIDLKRPTSYDQLSLSVELKNTGRVHCWVELGVDVLGPFDDFVASLTSKQPKYLLLPNETIVVPFSWGGELPAANYDLIASAYFGDGQVAIDQTRLEIADTSSAGVVRTAPAAAGVADAKPQASKAIVGGTDARRVDKTTPPTSSPTPKKK
jgi:hypothetical protein